MPCPDGVSVMYKGKAKKEIAKTSSHQKDIPQKEDCSPFCQCACCAGVTLVHPIIKDLTIQPQIENSYNSFHSSSINGISLAIWQPPQLA